MKKFFCLVLSATTMSCAGANISSRIRESPSSEQNLKIRCTSLDSGDDADLQVRTKLFDGWKMVYVSEYTTGNQVDTTVFMCFERPIKDSEGITDCQNAIAKTKEEILGNPESPELYDSLAKLLINSTEAECRNPLDAVSYATKACSLTVVPSWEHLSTLASAHAEAGNFDQAVKWMSEAKAVAPPEQKAFCDSRISEFQAKTH